MRTESHLSEKLTLDDNEKIDEDGKMVVIWIHRDCFASEKVED